MPRLTLNELKTALKLLDSSITAWHRTLRNPQTGSRISRAAIYRAIDENGPEWIIAEIQQVIVTARRRYPEYYARRKAAEIQETP